MNDKTKSKEVLTPRDLAERWDLTEETLAVWRMRDKRLIALGKEPKGPTFFKLNDSDQGEVRYRYEDICEHEKKGLRVTARLRGKAKVAIGDAKGNRHKTRKNNKPKRTLRSGR